MKLSLERFAAAVRCSLMTGAVWHEHFVAAMAEFEVDKTVPRAAGFLAQVAQESGNLANVEENLNYSVQGLADTWPKRFAIDPRARPRVPNALARQLGRIKGVQRCDQVKLANLVYANRMENGPPESGDGFRFIGRGPKQITGRQNYRRCGIALNLPLLERPDLLLVPRNGARAAAWYWADAGCNQKMDADDYEGVTRAINGALIGHEDGNDEGCDDRVERFEHARHELAERLVFAMSALQAVA